MGYLSVSREEALAKIHEVDRQRTEFIKKVFHRDYHDPAAHHLTVNTGTFTEAQTVDLILDAMKALQPTVAGKKHTA